MFASSAPFFLSSIPSVWSSIVILLTLMLIFGVSWFMFWILSHRSTTQRYWVMLGEWGRERGIRMVRIEDEIPDKPLDAITLQRVLPRVRMRGKLTTLLQFQSFTPAGPANPADRKVREGLWNILIREIETYWPPTALRPALTDASVVDLFSLPSFPLLGSSERFVAHGSKSKAAAALTRSSARGLLPPDIGLLLHGRTLVLDFSERPFDTVEFERMMAVAEQLVGHLPAADGME